MFVGWRLIVFEPGLCQIARIQIIISINFDNLVNYLIEIAAELNSGFRALARMLQSLTNSETEVLSITLVGRGNLSLASSVEHSN